MLRGISRDYVMQDLCKDIGIDCIEKNIEPYDVYRADEAFMTGTPFCMLPVCSLNSLAVGDGKVGPIFKSLMNRWSKNMGVDIPKQIKAWNAETDGSKNKSEKGPSPYRFQTETSH